MKTGHSQPTSYSTKDLPSIGVFGMRHESVMMKGCLLANQPSLRPMDERLVGESIADCSRAGHNLSPFL